MKGSLWVLEASYEIEREIIIEPLAQLMSMPALTFELKASLHQFIDTAKTSKYDLADLLITSHGDS